MVDWFPCESQIWNLTQKIWLFVVCDFRLKCSLNTTTFLSNPKDLNPGLGPKSKPRLNPVFISYNHRNYRKMPIPNRFFEIRFWTPMPHPKHNPARDCRESSDCLTTQQEAGGLEPESLLVAAQLKIYFKLIMCVLRSIALGSATPPPHTAKLRFERHTSRI